MDNHNRDRDQFRIKIVSVNGRVHHYVRAQSSLMTVDLNDLPTGAYFVHMMDSDEGNIEIKKIVKVD